jgi:hypothetical protein
LRISEAETTPPVPPVTGSGTITFLGPEGTGKTSYGHGTTVIEGLEDRLKDLERKVEDLYYPMGR